MLRNEKPIFSFFVILCLFLPLFCQSSEYSQFGIIGDTSIGKAEAPFLHFVEQLKKMGIKMFFHTGDVIHTPGSDAEWDRFLEIVGDRFEFHISPGNHDINSLKSLNAYKKKLKRSPYYSFESQDTIFLVLCTELPNEVARITGKQLLWLKEELRKTYRFKFLFLHRPLFSTVFGKSFCLDRYPEERDNLHRLFVENKVSCVFSGHEHIYNKLQKNGITYITTGGGGSKLLLNLDEYGGFHHYIVAKRSGDGYIFSVTDLKGRIRDEFIIKK